MNFDQKSTHNKISVGLALLIGMAVSFNSVGEEVSYDFGGQLRLRYEGWNNFGTNDTNSDESLLLTRLRLHSDIQVSDSLRVFVEGKSSLSTHMLRGFDRDEAALHQAFADLTVDDALSLRLGRQELMFGKSRLVSPLPWSNNMRTWDGVRADMTAGDWNIAAFWTEFVAVQTYDFNEADAQEQFYGAYATGPGIFGGKGMDAYLLVRDRKDVNGGDERYSLGSRLYGNLGDSGIDYDIEGTYQFGDRAGLDIHAYSIASQFGYALSESTRIFAGFDYASGDDDSTDGNSGTFDQIRPLGHAYFGYIDLIGRQNVMDFSAGISTEATDKVTIALTGHIFELAEDSDVLYNAGGASLAAANSGSADDEVGAEIDLTAKIAWDEQTAILLGYSHFFAGDYFDNGSNGSDIDFVYAQWIYNF